MRGTLPSRNKPIQSGLESTSPEEAQKKIINDAPLHTSLEEQTNPKEDIPQKPWRDGINLTGDELKTITEKVSMNMPLELLLRLDYILQHDKKNRILGKKLNKTTMYIEAIDKYTETKLKKMGFDVKD
ncbi:hypothetical protein [Acinetobacter pollinis]|uniref:hypothetical protein n=1 Tax=Acinetobacter pollinis TaxID=2605270 RepID=UPI0018A2CE31|nr:hypothetical protein [Acinetobacter pollinis]MBF7690855.1 hypothetical protein [Acinetobacter pollinis]MBF7698500.1 hypothetical protein [Acinetobacter pollinis]